MRINRGSAELVARQKGSVFVFAVVPRGMVPFAGRLVRPELVSHRRMQERVLVRQAV